MPRPRSRRSRGGTPAHRGEFALRRGDCAELSPLRCAPGRPRLRGQRRPDDLAEEVRPLVVGRASSPTPRTGSARTSSITSSAPGASSASALGRCGRRCSSAFVARRRRSSHQRATSSRPTRGSPSGSGRRRRRSRSWRTALKRATSRSTQRSSTTAPPRCSIRCPGGGPSQEEQYLGHEQTRAMRTWVREAIEKLDPRERFIVEVRMMADGPEELSLAENRSAPRCVARTRAPARGARQAEIKRHLETYASDLASAAA